MTLILSNEDIEKVLFMQDLVPVIEDAYRELVEGRGGNRLRSDIVTPTTQCADGLYALKSMDGVIPKLGVGAIRINSDILTFPQADGRMRRVKKPAAPGDTYVGLVLLFSTHDGAPLLICPDGVMQRLRVGATSAVAARHLAKKDSRTVAIIGAGWQAGSQLLGLDAVFALEDIRVFSPRKESREAFAAEMSRAIGKEVRPCASGAQACKGADIVACATNAVQPVFFEEWLEPGMHLGAIRPAATEIERAAWDKIDVIAILDYEDSPTMIYTHGVRVGEDEVGTGMGMPHDAFHASLPTLPAIMTGRREGRTGDDQITCFLNNLGMGYQFAAAGHVAYHKARAAGIGRELPTEWFTQTVHP
ncbi:MAG TPA: ornithine cyclodeaminase family protein [Xanthobacteraceae bacterium]|jgi:ornithine cyclodeaminase/alanine dehydrogenase-like protein (mu-crystallin family)